MKIGKQEFTFALGQAYIMGILNVTPDSFSDGGKYTTIDNALRQSERMIEDGADFIDIGGESTRPGHTQITTKEEIERITPVIRAIKNRFDIPISIDCYRSETLSAAIEAGADMANDIWGLQYDSNIAKVIADSDIPAILMHNRNEKPYDHFFDDFLCDMRKILNDAENAGIKKENIILDPGIGFAKDFEKDKFVLHTLEKLQTLQCPILLGTSRKRVLKNIVGEDMLQRDIATSSTTVLGYLKGVQIFRVHNVAFNRAALDTAMAIMHSEDSLCMMTK